MQDETTPDTTGGLGRRAPAGTDGPDDLDAVRFCSGPQLSKVISGTAGALSDTAIEEIAEKFD